MSSIDRASRILLRHAQGVSLAIAIILFILVGLFAMSGCGARYQPPGQDLWRAL
jgi:Tfp pilus assembly protein PilX